MSSVDDKKELFIQEVINKTGQSTAVRLALSKGYDKGYKAGYQDAVDKACECYCDNICEKGRSGMCHHKHGVEGQVKSTFKYNECNELQVIRRTMEE